MRKTADVEEELISGEMVKKSLQDEILNLKEEETSEKPKAKAASKKKTKTYASGTFYNHEYPGQHLEFWYEGTFISLKAGETIEIPLEIVNHIKKTCKVHLPKIIRTRPDDKEGIMGQKVIASSYQTQDFVIQNTFEKVI